MPFWLIPVFPPTEASTIESKVVGILTKKMVLKLTGYTELMQNEPANKASVDVREKIILPLVTIQQYALQQINFLRKNHPNELNQIVVFEKIVTRSLFGNINASRNSA